MTIRMSSFSSATISARFQHVDALFAGFDRMRKGNPLTFEFEQLGVHVTLPDGTKKQLLRGVSGTMLPGKVTAIMGPSGAGQDGFQ